MNIKTKYWLEENKGKLSILGSALLGFAIVGGGIFLFINDSQYSELAGPKVILASELLTRNEEGNLDVIEVESDKITDTIDLPNDVVLFKGSELDSLYYYDVAQGTIVQVVVEKGIAKQEVVTSIKDKSVHQELLKASSILTNDSHFAFLTEKKICVFTNEGELVLETKEELENADEIELSETNLYVSKDTKLYAIDLKSKEMTEIDIGDKTTRLARNGSYLMARNEFGSGKGTQAVLRVKDDSLTIEEVKKVAHEGKVDLPVPSDENQLVYITHRKDDNGVIERQDIVTMNAVGVKTDEGEELDSQETTIQLSTTGIFSEKTAIASNGFLYNLDPDTQEITITEIRNGREAKAVSVKTDKNHTFFVPIYDE